MKRILFMHQASSIGGGSYCLLNIIKELDKLQFEPVVALKDEGPLAVELRNMKIEVVLFPEMSLVPYNRRLLRLNSLKAYYKVKRSIGLFKILLQKVKADVLYLNNMMIYPYLRPAKELGLKTVIHVREHWPLDEHECQLEWARRSVYNYADKMIAINHYSASMFPQKTATIVYDWIDMEVRRKDISMSEILGEEASGKKVLLYTGGLYEIKGADYVVESFSKYIKGNEYRLLMLGVDLSIPLAGFRHLTKCVLALLGRRYFEREIRLKIIKDKRIKCSKGIYELTNLIEQSYCSVSYFRMPHANLALAENIIMGNASIAADTEESREYSGNGQFAMLVAPNRPQEFAESLIAFLEKHNEWSEKAHLGSSVNKEMFDKTINSRRLQKALEDLIKE